MIKIYRVAVDMIETGYVEVKATSMEEALFLATEESDNGGFIGYNSSAVVGEVLETRMI